MVLTTVTHLQMPLKIKIIATNTYAHFKHSLFVMILVDITIFASRLPHIYSSAFNYMIAFALVRIVYKTS